MSDRTLPIRFGLYAVVPAIGASSGSWTLALTAGAVLGLSGLGLEKCMRSFFDKPIAFLATLALLASTPLGGATDSADLGQALSFAAACVIFFWFAADPNPGAAKLVMTAALAIAPTIYAWNHASWFNVGPGNLLVALFSSTGLLYGAPLLWAGFLGLVALRKEKPGLTRLAIAAVVPGTLALLLATDRGDATARTAMWLPFLLPGIAECFERAETFAARRPQRVMAVAAALLILWNVLFMEQYRQRLLPSDDTVSFAQVTSNSATLLSRSIGTPAAWPANWLFAKRFNAPADRWDGVAGRRLFANGGAPTTTIEFGDDASVFAIDTALLLEGFGIRRTCEQGWCRDLDGHGRILLPLQDVGHGDLVIRLRARGQGALNMSLDGAATSVAEISAALSDVILRVPARLVEPGIRVLSLSVPGGGKATIDRLTLERDPSPSSAR